MKKFVKLQFESKNKKKIVVTENAERVLFLDNFIHPEEDYKLVNKTLTR